MTILVENKLHDKGTRTGQWAVIDYTGGRRREVSTHRLKRVAVSQGKKLARRKQTNIRIQDTNGQWRQGPSYA